MSDNTPTTPSTEQQILKKLYLAILLSFGLTLVPIVSMALVSSLLLLGLLIAAYVIRRRATEGSLLDHHTRYIIRTTWIGGFYALLLTMIASAYMIPNVDYTAFQPCADQMATTLGANATTEQISSYAKPCYDAFIAQNKKVFFIAMLISAAPLLLFFFLRFGRGFIAARLGQELTHPLRWW